MKEKLEKQPVNDENIQQIVSLLIENSDASKTIAFYLACSLDWNFKSVKHSKIVRILWSQYFGNFAEKDDCFYNAERLFVKIIIKFGVKYVNPFKSEFIPNIDGVSNDFTDKFIKKYGKRE
jgi:hypothetical protein